MIYVKFILLALVWLAISSAIYERFYRRYRNTDKSHAFEQKTIVRSQPAGCVDLKINEIEATERSRIAGDNAHEFRDRVLDKPSKRAT